MQCRGIMGQNALKSRETDMDLQQIIDQSDNIVFFGGAGVSTESGIPDFRSVDGLYSQKYKYPPETIISHTFFLAHHEGVLRVLQGQADP